jgi:hypothetical protein
MRCKNAPSRKWKELVVAALRNYMTSGIDQAPAYIICGPTNIATRHGTPELENHNCSFAFPRNHWRLCYIPFLVSGGYTQTLSKEYDIFFLWSCLAYALLFTSDAPAMSQNKTWRNCHFRKMSA